MENERVLMPARREFLRGICRGAALSVLGVGAAWLGLRAARSGCTQNLRCGSCTLAKDCTLPEKKV